MTSPRSILMKLHLIAFFTFLIPAIAHGWCFDATNYSGGPSNFFVAQAWTTDNTPTVSNGILPHTSAEIIADQLKHSRECTSLDMPKTVVLKPISIGGSNNLLGVRAEAIFESLSTRPISWKFRGVSILNNMASLRLETTKGVIVKNVSIQLAYVNSLISVASKPIFLIDPESKIFGENRAFIRLYNDDGSLLGSHEVTWKCKCKDCGAASGASDAAMGSVKYSMPITSVRNGLTPLAFGYDSNLLPNQGRGNLVLNGPQGTSAGGAVTVVNNTSNPTWIDSVTAGNIVANVASAATANDPLRFIVTVSSDKLNPTTSIFRTVIFETTDVSGSPAFKVTETLFGKVTESLYQTPDAATWQLTTGNGLRRLTEFTDTTSVVGQETKRTTLEQRSDAAATFQPISDLRSIRKKFSWGWETIQEISDPDGLALTTSWDYYEGAATNTAPPGSGTSNAGLGRIKSMTRYDGANELHYYSAPAVVGTYQRIHEILRPFAGTAAFQRSIESEGLDPIANLQTMLTETFIGSTQISKTTTQRATLTGVTTTRRYSDASNYLETVSTQELETDTRYENLPNGTRTESFKGPNGTLLRQVNSEGIFTTVPPSTTLV
jgi:hypothetical protein